MTIDPLFPPGTHIRGLVLVEGEGTCSVPGTVKTCEWSEARRSWKVSARMLDGSPDGYLAGYEANENGASDAFHYDPSDEWPGGYDPLRPDVPLAPPARQL